MDHAFITFVYNGYEVIFQMRADMRLSDVCENARRRFNIQQSMSLTDIHGFPVDANNTIGNFVENNGPKIFITID